MADTHSIITPAIMYWGTPVALITTLNKDGTPNIGPISSVWWLGHRCILGLASGSQTTMNLLRTKTCVINLASDDMARYINPIAKTTGTPTVPPGKKGRGYKHCNDKFRLSGLTHQESDLVQPPRITECPVQMEAEFMNSMELMQDLPDRKGLLLALEVKILRTHVRNDLRLAGHANRIDPDRWKPLIMSFQHFYGLTPSKVAESSLATIDEEKYRVITRSDDVKQGGDMDEVNGLEKS
ncbi:ydfE [Fusarium beomiforme]|uniref:YdfE n=1 Tax=Fusarium beomiforme TaxID=44412 RepID=A0A9P5ART0_9HYPO|nr:ydfE [Fusarium beomiforme]